MSNSLNLSLDVAKTGIQNPLIKVRQGDGGFETLRTTVTANGEPMDLQGWTITFMGTTAGNHKIVDGNVTLVEAPNGIFDYTPSKAWGMDIGEFKIAYFKFVKGDGSASSANFRVSVIESVDLTQEEAQNYISVVDTTIAEINQHLTDSLANVTKSIAEANSNVNTVASNVTALGNRVDDYNNKLAAIKVGGRNLLLGTSDWSGGSSRWNQRGTVTSTTYRGTLIAATSNAWISPTYMIQNVGILQVGKTYTFSTYVRNTSDTDTIVAFYYDSNIATQQAYSVALPAHTDWTRVSVTFKVLKDPTISNQGLRWEGQNTLTNGQIQFAGYKLEEGNVQTDWTPAPEDAPSNDTQLVHKTGTETIAGDKTLSGNTTFSGGVTGGQVNLPASGDLNTLTNTGKYYQTVSLNVANWTNRPNNAPNIAFSVDVIGQANRSLATQLYYVHTTNRMWVRTIWLDGSIKGSDWAELSNDANVVHKSGNESVSGDKMFTGVSTLTSVKSSGIKTGSVNLNGLTIDFRQTVLGVNVYMHGTFAGTFGTDQSYTTSSSVIPSNINNPVQTVVLTIVSNGGVSGITNNSPWELEVLLTATGAIQYRAKNLRDNDITARSTSIVGADSAFYTIE